MGAAFRIPHGRANAFLLCPVFAFLYLRVAESPLDLLLLHRLVQFCRVDGRV